MSFVRLLPALLLLLPIGSLGRRGGTEGGSLLALSKLAVEDVQLVEKGVVASGEKLLEIAVSAVQGNASLEGKQASPDDDGHAPFKTLLIQLAVLLLIVVSVSVCCITALWMSQSRKVRQQGQFLNGMRKLEAEAENVGSATTNDAGGNAAANAEKARGAALGAMAADDAEESAESAFTRTLSEEQRQLQQTCQHEIGFVEVEDLDGVLCSVCEHCGLRREVNTVVHKEEEEEESEGEQMDDSAGVDDVQSTPDGMAEELLPSIIQQLDEHDHARWDLLKAATKMGSLLGHDKAKAEEEEVPNDPRVYPKFNLKRINLVRDSCFNHDWQFVSESDIIPDADKEEVGKALHSKYLWVLPLYRRLSTQDTVEQGNTSEGICRFGVSLLSALRLLGKDPQEGINILDTKNLTKARAEEQYKHANHVPPGIREQLVCTCDKRLSRYQFATWLVRIARCKYPGKSLSEALQVIFGKLSKLCDRYSGDTMNLWTIGSSDLVEETYLECRPKIRAVFTRLAKSGNNSELCFTLTDWSRMIDNTQVYAIYPAFTRRDTAYSYRLGLQQASDEQFESSWQCMSFLEFQRGIGAVLFMTEWKSKGECSASALKELILQYVDRLANAYNLTAREIAQAHRRAVFEEQA